MRDPGTYGKEINEKTALSWTYPPSSSQPFLVRASVQDSGGGGRGKNAKEDLCAEDNVEVKDPKFPEITTALDKLNTLGEKSIARWALEAHNVCKPGGTGATDASAIYCGSLPMFVKGWNAIDILGPAWTRRMGHRSHRAASLIQAFCRKRLTHLAVVKAPEIVARKSRHAAAVRLQATFRGALVRCNVLSHPRQVWQLDSSPNAKNQGAINALRPDESRHGALKRVWRTFDGTWREVVVNRTPEERASGKQRPRAAVADGGAPIQHSEGFRSEALHRIVLAHDIGAPWAARRAIAVSTCMLKIRLVVRARVPLFQPCFAEARSWSTHLGLVSFVCVVHSSFNISCCLWAYMIYIF
jgi:hypothetical protein